MCIVHTNINIWIHNFEISNSLYLENEVAYVFKNNLAPNCTPFHSYISVEVKLCNSLNWDSPSKKFRSTEKNLQGPTEAFRESVTAHNSQPRTTTRSTAAGRLGLPELEWEPRRHINEERNREKLREHRTQPIVKE